MGTVSTHGINPALYRKLGYDALKDFAPISLAVTYPLVLAINPATVPVSDMTEFLAYVRQHPGKVNRGSAGNGTSMHIAGELFNSLADTRMTHVPYRGSAPPWPPCWPARSASISRAFPSSCRTWSRASCGPWP